MEIGNGGRARARGDAGWLRIVLIEGGLRGVDVAIGEGRLGREDRSGEDVTRRGEHVDERRHEYFDAVGDRARARARVRDTAGERAGERHIGLLREGGPRRRVERSAARRVPLLLVRSVVRENLPRESSDARPV